MLRCDRRRGMAFLRLWALAAVVLLLTYAPSAIAHNWMHTPSRARRAATTVKGCMQRKATDVHAQIGPGQRMSLKWATGHPRRKTYWVIMPGAYAFKLAMPAPDLVKLLDDYLDNRPDGVPNIALQPQHQRYHGNNKQPVELAP